MPPRILVIEGSPSIAVRAVAAAQAVATALSTAGFEVVVVESPQDSPHPRPDLDALGIDGKAMVDAISRLPAIESAFCSDEDGELTAPWYRAFAGRGGKCPRY